MISRQQHRAIMQERELKKENIKNLVSKDRLIEAIETLRKNDVDGSVEVQARHTRFLNQVIKGTLSYEDQYLELNKIRESVLYLAGIEDYEHTQEQVRPKFIPVDLRVKYQDSEKRGLQLGSILNGIIIINKNKNPDVVIKAQNILNEFLYWGKQKNKNPFFDVYDRELDIIEGKIANLIDFASGKKEEVKEESKEEFAKKIMDLFDGLIAREIVLKDAYNLCVNRGFRDTWIEDKLKIQFLEVDTRVEIQERIKYFVGSLFTKR